MFTNQLKFWSKNMKLKENKPSKIFKNFNFLIFLIYFVIPVILVKQKPPIIARFRATRCSSSNKTFNANITCSVKAYDRYVAKLTVLVNFDIKTYQIMVCFSQKIHRNLNF